MNCFELMNFLSGAFLNRIFDVEFDSNINLEGINKSKVNKNIEVCQQFTLNKNLKEIYEKVEIEIYLLNFLYNLKDSSFITVKQSIRNSKY